MTAALGTLAFLTTLWLLGTSGAAILEESGAKIAAALKGQSPARSSTYFPPARFRTRAWLRQPMRVRPKWRDAA